MMEWQAIDTAPKDGTIIDLWCKLENNGWRRVPNARWNFALNDWQLGQHNASEYMVRPEITHWMALPEPPGQPT